MLLGLSFWMIRVEILLIMWICHFVLILEMNHLGNDDVGWLVILQLKMLMELSLYMNKFFKLVYASSSLGENIHSYLWVNLWNGWTQLPSVNCSFKFNEPGIVLLFYYIDTLVPEFWSWLVFVRPKKIRWRPLSCCSVDDILIQYLVIDSSYFGQVIELKKDSTCVELLKFFGELLFGW